MKTKEKVVLIATLALIFAMGGQVLALDPNELLTIQVDLHQAPNARDLEGYFSYITDDSTYEFVDALPAPLSGRAEIVGFFAQVLEAFPDLATDDGLVIALAGFYKRPC